MMKCILILSLVFSTLSWADELSLKNDREGKSFYQSWFIKRKIKNALKAVSSDEMKMAFEDSLSELTEDNLCSFDLNNKILSKIKTINPKFDEFEGALYQLRNLDSFDDVTLSILLKANEVQSGYVDLPKDQNDLWLPVNETTVKKSLELIAGIKSKLKTTCLDEAFRGLHGELYKLDSKMTSFFIEALLVEAFEKKLIDYKTYLTLEKARIYELEKEPLTLKTYFKKIQKLRKNSPELEIERSDFITSKLRKNTSRRMHLLESYSELQILLMADLIQKFRSRLESSKIEILVYERDEVDEVITLEPMERFRFALKILRKEMKMLSINTYFKGITPSYVDLMSAAYETGVITSLEIDELAGLEEIWNPKKSFWDKARFWVQSFGTVATILIPPPFGFIPSLALVVIEATTQKKDPRDADLGLF